MAETDKVYFSEDFQEFFKELAANNHKDWFDENRRRYEKNVKKPFEDFINSLIAEVQKVDPEIQITAKEAIFRINRDIRFAKDKSPYKLDRAAIISASGRKDKSTPGMYISLGPEKVVLGGGAYSLNPVQLQQVRQKITDESGRFSTILEDKQFNHTFDQILGTENKRLPKELRDAAAKQPLLFKKQFYYMDYQKPELVTSKELLPLAVDRFIKGYPLLQFLKEAIE